MATSEESCDSNPNFAIICSFITKFGEECGVRVSIPVLQQMLEDTKNVSEELKDIHIHLLRKGKKRVNKEKWERSLIKFCHEYSSVHAWELERFGYKKAKLSVKLDIVKHLLELQFDSNAKFKAEVNKRDAESLRVLPTGRDIDGHMYWYQIDKEYNMRLYRQDVNDENSWHLLCSSKDGLKDLLINLAKKSIKESEEFSKIMKLEPSSEATNEVPVVLDLESNLKEEGKENIPAEHEDLKASLSLTNPCAIIIKTEKKETRAVSPSLKEPVAEEIKVNGHESLVDTEVKKAVDSGDTKSSLPENEFSDIRTIKKEPTETLAIEPGGTSACSRLDVITLSPADRTLPDKDENSKEHKLCEEEPKRNSPIKMIIDKSKLHICSDSRQGRKTESEPALRVECVNTTSETLSKQIISDSSDSSKQSVDNINLIKELVKSDSIDLTKFRVGSSDVTKHPIKSNSNDSTKQPIKRNSSESTKQLVGSDRGDSTKQLVEGDSSNSTKQHVESDSVDLTKHPVESPDANKQLVNNCKGTKQIGVNSNVSTLPDVNISSSEKISEEVTPVVPSAQKSDQVVPTVTNTSSTEYTVTGSTVPLVAGSNIEVSKTDHSQSSVTVCTVSNTTMMPVVDPHSQPRDEDEFSESTFKGGKIKLYQKWSSEKKKLAAAQAIGDGQPVSSSVLSSQIIERPSDLSGRHINSSETTLHSSEISKPSKESAPSAIESVQHKSVIKSNCNAMDVINPTSVIQVPMDLSIAHRGSDSSECVSPSTNLRPLESSHWKSRLELNVKPLEKLDVKNDCSTNSHATNSNKVPHSPDSILQRPFKKKHLLMAETLKDSPDQTRHSVICEVKNSKLMCDSAGNLPQNSVLPVLSSACSPSVPDGLCQIGSSANKEKVPVSNSLSVDKVHTVSSHISHTALEHTNKCESIVSPEKATCVEQDADAQHEKKKEAESDSPTKVNQCAVPKVPKPISKQEESVSTLKSSTDSISSLSVPPENQIASLNPVQNTQKAVNVVHSKSPKLSEQNSGLVVISKLNQQEVEKCKSKGDSSDVIKKTEMPPVSRGMNCYNVSLEVKEKTGIEGKTGEVKISFTDPSKETSKGVIEKSDKTAFKESVKSVRDIEEPATNGHVENKSHAEDSLVDVLAEHLSGKFIESKPEHISETKEVLSGECSFQRDGKLEDSSTKENERKVNSKFNVKEGESKHVKEVESKHVKDGESKRVKDSESKHVKDGESKHMKDGESKHVKDGESKHVEDGESKCKNKSESKLSILVSEVELASIEKDKGKMSVQETTNVNKKILPKLSSPEDNDKKDIPSVSKDSIEENEKVVSSELKDLKAVVSLCDDAVTPKNCDVIKTVQCVESNSKITDEVSPDKACDIFPEAEAAVKIPETAGSKTVEDLSKNKKNCQKAMDPITMPKIIAETAVNDQPLEKPEVVSTKAKEFVGSISKKTKVKSKCAKTAKQTEGSVPLEEIEIVKQKNTEEVTATGQKCKLVVKGHKKEIALKDSNKETVGKKISGVRDKSTHNSIPSTKLSCEDGKIGKEAVSEQIEKAVCIKENTCTEVQKETICSGVEKDIPHDDENLPENGAVEGKEILAVASEELSKVEMEEEKMDIEAPPVDVQDHANKNKVETKKKKPDKKSVKSGKPVKEADTTTCQKTEESFEDPHLLSKLCPSLMFNICCETKCSIHSIAYNANNYVVKRCNYERLGLDTSSLLTATSEPKTTSGQADVEMIDAESPRKTRRQTRRDSIVVIDETIVSKKEKETTTPSKKVKGKTVIPVKMDKSPSPTKKQADKKVTPAQEKKAPATQEKKGAVGKKEADKAVAQVAKGKGKVTPAKMVKGKAKAPLSSAKEKALPSANERGKALSVTTKAKTLPSKEKGKTIALAGRDQCVGKEKGKTTLSVVKGKSTPPAKKKGKAVAEVKPLVTDGKDDDVVVLDIQPKDANENKTSIRKPKRNRGRPRNKGWPFGPLKRKKRPVPKTVQSDFPLPEGFLEILDADKAKENVAEKTSEKTPAKRGRKRKEATSSVQSSENELTPRKRSTRIQEQHHKKMSELAVEMQKEQRRLEQLAKKNTTPVKRNIIQAKVIKQKQVPKLKFQPPDQEDTCLDAKMDGGKRGRKARAMNMAKLSLLYDEGSKDSEHSTSRSTEKSRRRRSARGRRRGYKPWDLSSESSSTIEEISEEEEEEEPEEQLIFNANEDEFACEEIDEDAEPVVVRRARTAKGGNSYTAAEGDGGEEKVIIDDKPCSKCGKYDRPEWILLCDKCDDGYHTNCLVPPLVNIPDGDWFCQPCEHLFLCECLNVELQKLEQLLKQKEREELRKQRLAYVGISLDNVLKPEKKESCSDTDENSNIEQPKEIKKSRTREREVTEDEYHEKVYGKRSARTRRTVNYQFKEYDELIASAIGDDMIDYKFDDFEAPEKEKNASADELFKVEKPPPRKARRTRKFKDLDYSDDDGSGEEYKGLSSDSERTPSENTPPSQSGSDAASGEWRIVKSKPKRPRRNTRRRGKYSSSGGEEEDLESDGSNYRPTTRRATQKQISYRELSSEDEWEEAPVKLMKKIEKKRKKDNTSESSEASFKVSSKSKKKKSRTVRRWEDSTSSSESEEKNDSGESSESGESESTRQSAGEWKIEKKSSEGGGIKININKKVLDSNSDSSSSGGKVVTKKRVNRLVSDESEEEEDDDDDDAEDEEDDDDESESESSQNTDSEDTQSINKKKDDMLGKKTESLKQSDTIKDLKPKTCISIKKTTTNSVSKGNNDGQKTFGISNKSKVGMENKPVVVPKDKTINDKTKQVRKQATSPQISVKAITIPKASPTLTPVRVSSLPEDVAAVCRAVAMRPERSMSSQVVVKTVVVKAVPKGAIKEIKMVPSKIAYKDKMDGNEAESPKPASNAKDVPKPEAAATYISKAPVTTSFSKTPVIKNSSVTMQPLPRGITQKDIPVSSQKPLAKTYPGSCHPAAMPQQMSPLRGNSPLRAFGSNLARPPSSSSPLLQQQLMSNRGSLRPSFPSAAPETHVRPSQHLTPLRGAVRQPYSGQVFEPRSGSFLSQALRPKNSIPQQPYSSPSAGPMSPVPVHRPSTPSSVQQSAAPSNIPPQPYTGSIVEPFSSADIDQGSDSRDEIPLEPIPSCESSNPAAPYENKGMSFEKDNEYRPAEEAANFPYTVPEEKAFPSTYSPLSSLQEFTSRPSPLKPSLVETYSGSSSPTRLTSLDSYPQSSSPKGFISLDSYAQARKRGLYSNLGEQEAMPRPAATSESYQQGEPRFGQERYNCPPSPNTYTQRSPTAQQRDPGTPPRLYSQFPDSYAPPRSPEYYQNQQYYPPEEGAPRPGYQANYTPPDHVQSYPYMPNAMQQQNDGFMIDSILRARNEEDEIGNVSGIVQYITQQ